jgi:hypothetical protein
VLGTDGRLRCVTNRIDDVDARWLRLRFDAAPDGTELEGVAGDLRVAGVSSWQDHDGPLGTYGCIEHYARVSPHVSWIRSVVGPAS